MRYAPISGSARDVAALDRVLAIGGVPRGRRLQAARGPQYAAAAGEHSRRLEARTGGAAAGAALRCFDEMLERTPKLARHPSRSSRTGRIPGAAILTFGRSHGAPASCVRRRRQAGRAEDVRAGAFQALAGYIFGKNKREERWPRRRLFLRGPARWSSCSPIDAILTDLARRWRPRRTWSLRTAKAGSW